MNDETFTCYQCGQAHDLEDESEHVPEVCEECVQDDYFECEDCGAYHHWRDESSVSEVCDDCYADEYTTCDRCSDDIRRESGDLIEDDHGTLCRPCFERYFFVCESCDHIESIYDRTNHRGEDLCEGCAEEHRAEDQSSGMRNMLYEGETYAKALSRPNDQLTRGLGFGVEVEVNFPGDCPWELDGYHSGAPAPWDFFGGWKAEHDGTVDAEFISPRLYGSEGLAELLATYDFLKNEDAYAGSNSGQHVNIGVSGFEHAEATQMLAATIEEGLFATTAAFRRMMDTSGYARRLKIEPGYPSMGGDIIRGRETVCQVRNDMCVEFRYPPGTLNAAQGAINVGLSQMVAIKARELGLEGTRAMFDEAIAEHLNGEIDPAYKVQRQIVSGLRFLASSGWCAGGWMEGLPYDPDSPPTITMIDHANSHRVKVTLPTREEIEERLVRQITRLYGRFASEMGLSSEVKDIWQQQALSVMGLSEEPEAEIPETASGEAPMLAQPQPEPELEEVDVDGEPILGQCQCAMCRRERRREAYTPSGNFTAQISDEVTSALRNYSATVRYVGMDTSADEILEDLPF